LQRGGELEAYVALKRGDLRLGRVGLHVFGRDETCEMVVEQSPVPSGSIPVGCAVDVWLTIPVGDTIMSEQPGPDDACRR